MSFRDLEGWTEEDLLKKVGNFGVVKLGELKAALADVGLSLPFKLPPDNCESTPKALTRVVVTESGKKKTVKLLPLGTEVVLNNGAIWVLDCKLGRGDKVFSDDVYKGRIVGLLTREVPGWHYRSYSPYGLAFRKEEWVWLRWETIVNEHLKWFRRL